MKCLPNNYFIEHPQGNIYFKASSKVTDKEKAFLKGKDFGVLFLGVAGALNLDAIKKDIMKGRSVHTIVPIHHDNFFAPLSEDLPELFTLDTQKIKAKLLEGEKNRAFYFPKPGVPWDL